MDASTTIYDPKKRTHKRLSAINGIITIYSYKKKKLTQASATVRRNKVDHLYQLITDKGDKLTVQGTQELLCHDDYYREAQFLKEGDLLFKANETEAYKLRDLLEDSYEYHQYMMQKLENIRKTYKRIYIFFAIYPYVLIELIDFIVSWCSLIKRGQARIIQVEKVEAERSIQVRTKDADNYYHRGYVLKG